MTAQSTPRQGKWQLTLLQVPKILRGDIRALISPMLLAYLSIGAVAASADFFAIFVQSARPFPTEGSVLKAPPPPPLKNSNEQVKQTLATAMLLTSILVVADELCCSDNEFKSIRPGLDAVAHRRGHGTLKQTRMVVGGFGVFDTGRDQAC